MDFDLWHHRLSMMRLYLGLTSANALRHWVSVTREHLMQLTDKVTPLAWLSRCIHGRLCDTWSPCLAMLAVPKEKCTRGGLVESVPWLRFSGGHVFHPTRVPGAGPLQRPDSMSSWLPSDDMLPPARWSPCHDDTHWPI